MIIIDRVLYLCKNITIKVIFHFFTILSTHVWMFFILPAVTGRRFNATAPPVMYYIIKCFYLLLSAYQIRCGYPARVLGNFLMKNHNIMNLVGFKAFMTLPFLFELRTLIDWMCTSTSLSLSEWLKVETIHVQVFTIKCFRNLGASEQRGNRKSKFVKFFVGGGLTLLLVAVLWFPLAVFAYSGALGQSNVPNDGTISLQIGTFESIYNTNAHKNNIHTFQNSDFNNLKSIYEKYAPARLFIEDFEAEDVAAIRLSTESSSQWSISPPLHRKMIEQLRNNVPMICRLSYSMSHKTQSKSVPEKLSGSIDYELNDEKIRKKLMEALENTDENRTDAVTIPFIFPKFISIKKNEELEIIPQLLLSSESMLRNCFMLHLLIDLVFFFFRYFAASALS